MDSSTPDDGNVSDVFIRKFTGSDVILPQDTIEPVFLLRGIGKEGGPAKPDDTCITHSPRARTLPLHLPLARVHLETTAGIVLDHGDLLSLGADCR
jgi:hypothetical protein